MKQFSLCSIKKWLENTHPTQDDQLVNYLTQKKIQEKIQPTNTCFRKPSYRVDDSQQTINSLPTFQGYQIKRGHSIQYVMDVKIKEVRQKNMKKVIELFLAEEQIQGVEIEEFVQQRRVRIVGNMDSQKFQTLKNKISTLEEAQMFESKKKDKRPITLKNWFNRSGKV